MTRLIAWSLAARRVARRGGDGTALAFARLRAWRAGAPLAVLIGAGIAGLFVASIAVRSVQHTFDEDLYKQSAVHYANDGMPRSLFHDVFARGTARLYSLLLAPFFRFFDGDTAIRASHALSTLLFVSAAAPAYLLARRVVRSRWLSAFAALAAVVCPWAALATTLYSENVAYPLLLWTLLAMWWALDKPSPRRDVVVIAAILALGCTRVQFLATLAPWVLLIAIRELGPAGQARLRYGRWGAARQIVRAYPLTSAIFGLAVLGALVSAAAGHLHADIQRVLGSYGEIQDRKTFGQPYSEAIGTEVMAIAFGIGIVPAVVGAAWYARAAVGEIDARAREFAIVVLGFLIPTILLTVYAQGGYLGEASEERYYFYIAPLLWIGTMAAYESRAIPRRTLWVTGALLVVAVATIDILTDPTNGSYAFLAPVHLALGHVVPAWLGDLGRKSAILGTLNPRDARVLLAIAGIALTAILWRHVRTRTLLIAVAAAVQVAFTGWALAAIDGKVKPVQGRTGSGWTQLAWVDHLVPRKTRVAWLDNQPLDDPRPAQDRQRDTAFFNDSVRRELVIPALNRPISDPSIAGQPNTAVSVGRDGTLTLDGHLDSGYVISADDSPVLQIGGQRLGTDPYKAVSLLRVSGTVRASWLATGLAGDGWIEKGQRARLSLFSRGPQRVVMTFAGPPGGQGDFELDFGGKPRAIVLNGGQVSKVVSNVCGPVTGAMIGGEQAPLVPNDPNASRNVSAALRAVQITPRAGRC